MKYFKSASGDELVRYEEGSLCEVYDYQKQEWKRDYKTFAKMCIGDLEADLITEEEAKQIIEGEGKKYERR